MVASGSAMTAASSRRRTAVQPGDTLSRCRQRASRGTAPAAFRPSCASSVIGELGDAQRRRARRHRSYGRASAQPLRQMADWRRLRQDTGTHREHAMQAQRSAGRRARLARIPGQRHTGTTRSLAKEMVTRVPRPGALSMAAPRRWRRPARGSAAGRGPAPVGARPSAAASVMPGPVSATEMRERTVDVVGDGDRHPVAGPRELDGVGEQVEQHLPEATARRRRCAAGAGPSSTPSARPARSASGRATVRQLSTTPAGSRSAKASDGSAERVAIAPQHAVDHAERMPRAVVDVARVARDSGGWRAGRSARS